MARKITQKQLKHDEFVDAAFDMGHWLEHHGSTVALGVAGAVVLTLAIVGGIAWSRNRAERAAEALAQAIDRYEEAEAGGFADPSRLTAALESFDAAARGGGSSEAVARFYSGATLFRLGRLDEARSRLEAVVSTLDPADTVGATAQVMLARVHVAAGREEEALTLLEALAAQPSKAISTDQVLLELGRLHRDADRPERAREQWQRVIDEYPSTPSAAEARSLIQ